MNLFEKLKQPFKIIKTFRSFPFFLGVKLGFLKNSVDSEAVLWNGIRYRVDPEDPDISRWIIQEVWSDNVYRFTEKDALKARVVVDVGASIGTFSIFAAVRSPQATVYSFEPNPSYYRLLNKNIELNRLRDRVLAFQEAVSSRRRQRKFFLSEKSPTRNSLFKSDYLETGSRSIEVSSTTLKNIFRDNRIQRCDFLKLDCEGGEFDILLHAPTDVLKRIRKISLEYHDGITGYGHADLVDFLRSQDFSVATTPSRSGKGLGFLWAEKETDDGRV